MSFISSIMSVFSLYKSTEKKDNVGDKSPENICARETAAFSDDDLRAEKFICKGIKLWMKRNIRGAEKYFGKAADSAVTAAAKAKSLQLLGLTALQMQDFSSAENYLKEAIALDSEDAETHLYLGQAYFYGRKHNKALEVLESGLNAKSASEDNIGKIHSFAGMIYFEKQLYEKALEHYMGEYSLNPEDKTCSANLAAVYAMLGNTEKTWEFYHKAVVSLGFEDKEAYRVYLNDCLRGEGNTAPAVDSVGFIGKYILRTESQEQENCTLEDCLNALKKLSEGRTEFVVLTPPAETEKGFQFLQVTCTDEDTLRWSLQFSRNKDGQCYMYEKALGDFDEIIRAFEVFYKSGDVPDSDTYGPYIL